VEDVTWSDVERLKVGGEPIPRLDDVLGAWPDVRINLDPKMDSAIEPLADAVRRTATVDRVCIASFSGRRITRLRRLLGPHLCTSLGPTAIARVRGYASRSPGPRPAGACLQVPERGPGGIPLANRAVVDAAHRWGLQVHVWTVDEDEAIHRLLDAGVDGIMTDRPTVLKEVLVSRVQWA
jgi:glycerophosphoryl diester phosphodiesterase